MIFSDPSKMTDYMDMLNSIEEAQNYLGFYFLSKYTRKECV